MHVEWFMREIKKVGLVVVLKKNSKEYCKSLEPKAPRLHQI